MKHTPGPWEANGVLVVASNDSFRTLFECKPLTMTLSVEECEANAHLIAAAPELLEACKEALNYVQGHNNDEQYYTPRIERKLEQAIAKAQGEKINE